jgi:hypothetical protein
VALVGFGITLRRNQIVEIIPIKKNISLGGRW